MATRIRHPIMIPWLPIFRNLFPENLVQACFQQVKTIYVEKKETIIPPDHNDSTITTTVSTVTDMANVTKEMKRALQFQDGMNVLGE